MISTLAPLVMASCASVSSVASLPCAFCTENCVGERPAVVSASVRYGASNSVYRAEVTVSGRIAAMFPLPLAANAFSSVITEKVRVKEETVIEGTFTEPEPPEPVDDELLPQAARSRPATAASEIVMLFLVTSSKKTTFCRQSRGLGQGRVPGPFQRTLQPQALPKP